MIVTLAGGVGAARFLEGLARVALPSSITVIVNTGDDIDLYGLRISPDLDIVMYTLAGLVDDKQGWGILGDTYHTLDMLKRYGHDTWFQLGDRDLATHIHRTQLMQQGQTLAEVSDQIRRSLSLETCFLPMSNERVTTRILTPSGSLHFEEYLVQRRASDPVEGVQFAGIESAHPAPGVLEAIAEAEANHSCAQQPHCQHRHHSRCAGRPRGDDCHACIGRGNQPHRGRRANQRPCG